MRGFAVRLLGLGALVLATAFAAPAHATAAAAPSPKHILLLYAYGYGGRGVELFSEGFFKSITEAGFPVSNVYAEYLDLQRNKDVPGYRAEVLDVLRKKYAQRPVDLIVTLQQPALEFLLTDGKDIAPQAPVITIQHRPLLDAEKGGRRIVGEINRFDVKGTLERALELFPQTRRVLFASGSSAADLKLAEEAAHIAEAWRGRLEVETTTGMALPAILDRVGRLPPDSIVVFTQYNVDSEGRVALAYEAEKLIVKAANAPVFGFYDYNLRNGGIGGSVIAVEASGARTARLALSILHGEEPAAVGALTTAEAVPMFDWQQIQRWRGHADGLRVPAEFVNRPPSVWERHGRAIVATAAFILAQSVLIAFLVANIRRRKRAETVQARSEERFRRLFNDAPLPLCFVDKDGVIVDRNARFVQTFGYTSQDVSTLADWWPLAYPDPEYRQWAVDTWNSALARATETGADIEPTEYRVICKDGSRRDMLISGIVIGQDFLATFFDVTERRGAEQALAETQAAALEEQNTARLAALNLMEDAVAERQRAEAAAVALRDSEDKYRQLFESSRDALLTLGPPTWRFASANRAALELYGVESLADFMALTPADVSPARQPDGRTSVDKAREMIERALRDGTAFFEWEHRRRDGAAFAADVLLTRMEKDGAVWLHASVREVGARKAAEAESRRRNEELERFNLAMVGRELDMIALKRQVNELSRELGREAPFGLSFADAPGPGVPPNGDAR